MKKIRWGVLSTANIGVKKVLPAMQRGQLSSIAAIASRDLAKARAVATQLDIPTAYGSYEELLAEAGKHVLSEKPIAMSADEARTLLAVRERTGVLIGEAFMIRSHPQWLRVRALMDEGRIGTLRSVAAYFSYFNTDPANIRNQPETGGGALYDIGCYCIQSARYAFGAQPTRVCGLIDRDPQLGTDRLTSALLDFPAGQAIFTSSTQLVPYQRVQLFGTKGRIEIEIPFNAPPDRPTRLFIDDGSDITGARIVTETFPVVDQYTLQGDAFSRAILEGTPVPVSLEEGIANMAVIDAIFASAKSRQWEPVSP